MDQRSLVKVYRWGDQAPQGGVGVCHPRSLSFIPASWMESGDADPTLSTLASPGSFATLFTALIRPGKRLPQGILLPVNYFRSSTSTCLYTEETQLHPHGILKKGLHREMGTLPHHSQDFGFLPRKCTRTWTPQLV